jgi:protein-tyrosine-phosphatase
MARLPGSVLFACTLNSIRSPMAAALLRALHGRRVFVDSVGVRSAPIDPFAVAVMAEIGIDIAAHQPKSFDELEDTSFDLIISLSPDAQHAAVELTRSAACDVEFWPVLDPTGLDLSREETLATYRMVRDQLRKRIAERFPAEPSAEPR